MRFATSLPVRHAPGVLKRSRGALLASLVALGVLLAHGDAGGAALNLNWTDNSGGQAQFGIERKTGTAGIFSEIAQQPAGLSSYADSTVSPGTQYCYRVRAFDPDGYSPYSNESCGSSGQGFVVSVNKGGSGTGTVSSSPPGINCGADCSEPYASGSVVNLTAAPAAGATFSGWSGGGCSGTGPCTVTGNAPTSVSANFTATPSSSYALTTSTTGTGTITSNPGGITCGSDCSESYAAGAVVTLTATPQAGATFSGWNGGGCSGTGPCTVTLNANTSVSAGFAGAPPPPPAASSFTLGVGKFGQGLVQSDVAGIACGAQCSKSYLAGTLVTLMAKPAVGSVFLGWLGACRGTGTCKVPVNSNTKVGALFWKR